MIALYVVGYILMAIVAGKIVLHFKIFDDDYDSFGVAMSIAFWPAFLVAGVIYLVCILIWKAIIAPLPKVQLPKRKNKEPDYAFIERVEIELGMSEPPTIEEHWDNFYNGGKCRLCCPALKHHLEKRL